MPIYFDSVGFFFVNCDMQYEARANQFIIESTAIEKRKFLIYVLIRKRITFTFT